METSSMETLTVDRYPAGLINPLEQKDWETALTVILHSPHSTKRINSARGLPLHFAFCRAAPVEVLIALLEAYPDATRTRNDVNNLPCHTACCYGTSSEGMKMLLRCNPDVAGVMNNRRKTPVNIINECKWRFFVDEKDQVIKDLERNSSYWKSKEQQALLQSAFEETDRRRSMRRSVARIILGQHLEIYDLIPLIIGYL
jgi:hypothetical protein